MGDELTIHPADTAKYQAERHEVVSILLLLGARPHPDGHFLLGEPSSSWGYDVRLWVRADDVFVEVSATVGGYRTVLVPFYAWMRERHAAVARDEDGELALVGKYGEP